MVPSETLQARTPLSLLLLAITSTKLTQNALLKSEQSRGFLTHVSKDVHSLSIEQSNI